MTVMAHAIQDDNIIPVLPAITVPSVCEHYFSLITNQKVTEIGNDISHLGSVIVGDAGYSKLFRRSKEAVLTAEASGYLYNPMLWKTFRNHVWRKAGVPKMRKAGKKIIIINSKGTDTAHNKGQADRRRILNAEALAKHLRSVFPKFSVRLVNFQKHSVSQQVQLMSSARIFVTTQGSSAHRLVFMPDDSIVTVIGSWTFGKTYCDQGTWPPFHELRRYFSISNIRFIGYPLSKNDKVVIISRTAPFIHDHCIQRRWDVYNADVEVHLP
jgi:hypothetical protein